MPMIIAVLEDNDDRIAVMRGHLADKFPFFESRFFQSADEAVDWLRGHMDQTICCALDHDLERPLDKPDPGSGRDVADFLADREPRFPVIVHSTNLHAAIAMEALLEERGWSVSRVSPYGDLQWIAEVWLPAIRGAIVAQTAMRVSSRDG